MPLSHRRPDHTASGNVVAHSPELSSLLRFHPDVRHALDNARPVVALESTIIAHGMPYPANYETALALHAVVRHHGAVPATIAVLSGHVHIGLTDAQLHQFAYNGGGGGGGGGNSSSHHQHSRSDDSQNSKHAQQPRRRVVRKLGLRELSHCLTAGTFSDDDGFQHNISQDGATTVSATMYIANMVGIDVFATGGIGGVHRGVTQSWDVSADIHALASLPVLVVCAGVKAILDIDKTLQALESACVPVLVLGSQRFPAFYTADSGASAPASVSSTAHVAATFDMHLTLGLKSGMLLAVPIPRKHEPDAAGIQQAIEQAVKEVDMIGNNMNMQQQKQVIKPQDVTPVLLKRVTQLTGGQSLKANIALVKNNAAVAAQIAVQLMAIRRKQQQQQHYNHYHLYPQSSSLLHPPQSQPESLLRNRNQPEVNQNGHVLSSNGKSNIDHPFDSFRDPSAPADMAVIGATVLDVIAQPARVGPGHGAGTGVQSTALGTVTMRVGGVAWNVAFAAARFSRARVRLLSAVGNDSQAHALTSLMVSERASCADRLDICAPMIEQRRGAVVSITHCDNGDLLVRFSNNIYNIYIHIVGCFFLYLAFYIARMLYLFPLTLICIYRYVFTNLWLFDVFSAFITVHFSDRLGWRIRNTCTACQNRITQSV